MSNDDRRIVRLASVPTEREASVLMAALEEQGIKSRMSGEMTARFRAAPNWVHVLVFEDDLPAARQALASGSHAGESVDWSHVDVGQPEEPGEERAAPTHLMSRKAILFVVGLILAVVLLAWVLQP